MQWEAALDLVVAHTKHERYRALCDSTNPGHLVWRQRMVDKAALLGTAPVPSRFRREDPDYTVPPRPLKIAREVVCSRYQEDISWLSQVPSDFYINVYGKSDWDYTLDRDHRYQRLPNLGREAHTILWHITRFYESLADWTYFVQGDGPIHAPDIVGRLQVPYEGLCSLTDTYSPVHPPVSIREYDRVEVVGGYRVAYGDAVIDLDNGRGWFNPAAWSYVFDCPQPRPLYFGYAAHWAVPRAVILARPKGLWHWLLAEVEKTPCIEDSWTDPPLTAWAVEVLWKYLWSDPKTYPHKWAETKAKPRGCGCNRSKVDSSRSRQARIQKLRGKPLGDQGYIITLIP